MEINLSYNDSELIIKVESSRDIVDGGSGKVNGTAARQRNICGDEEESFNFASFSGGGTLWKRGERRLQTCIRACRQGLWCGTDGSRLCAGHSRNGVSGGVLIYAPT